MSCVCVTEAMPTIRWGAWGGVAGGGDSRGPTNIEGVGGMVKAGSD